MGRIIRTRRNIHITTGKPRLVILYFYTGVRHYLTFSQHCSEVTGKIRHSGYSTHMLDPDLTVFSQVRVKINCLFSGSLDLFFFIRIRGKCLDKSFRGLTVGKASHQLCEKQLFIAQEETVLAIKILVFCQSIKW